MADDTRKIDPKWAWAAYKPTPQAPWDKRLVGHLYRRAAFGSTLTEQEQALKDGPVRTLDRLWAGSAGMADFDKRMAPLAETIARTNNATLLRSWWLTRMLYSPRPLEEKLTLFWHNHFATSNAKVQSARLMLGQYDLLRKHALGNFGALLKDMSYDPAMLIWLDGRGSKRGNPNENYAREVMELFSLGVGNYSEQDIREAARAFTGWDVENNRAVFRKEDHDAGEKIVLELKGRWGPDDIVRICLEQPSCPYFIVGKLFRFLVSDTLAPTRALLTPLADGFRRSKFDFGTLVRTMLSSNLFFSPEAYRTKVKSPIDFGLSMVRALEGRIGAGQLATVLEQLGQSVFNPPSVKGWDGGQAWLNGQTLLYRQNLALAFCSTEDNRFGTRLDPATLARKHNKRTDEELVNFFLDLFLQGDVPEATRKRLVEFQASAHKRPAPVFWTAQDAADHRVRTLCHLVLTQPEFQLD